MILAASAVAECTGRGSDGPSIHSHVNVMEIAPLDWPEPLATTQQDCKALPWCFPTHPMIVLCLGLDKGSTGGAST